MEEYERRANQGDILRAIGNLEGKMDAIHQAMLNNRTDIIEAFRRLGIVERRIAQGVILCAVISFVMPLLVTMAGPRLQFGHPSDRSHHGMDHREHA